MATQHETKLVSALERIAKAIERHNSLAERRVALLGESNAMQKRGVEQVYAALATDREGAK